MPGLAVLAMARRPGLAAHRGNRAARGACLRNLGYDRRAKGSSSVAGTPTIAALRSATLL